MALTYVSNSAEVPRGTLTQLFFDVVDTHDTGVAMRYFPGDGPTLQDISYDEVREMVRACADGLLAAGMGPDDRVAILAENRPEWLISDYACLCGRFQDVPIHSTLPAEQIAYILSDSGARLVFAADQEQMEKVLQASKSLPHAVSIVVFDPPAEIPDGVVTWSEHLDRGRALEGRRSEADFKAHALTAEPDEVATILYTSGTTGNPKGVMLTHDNLCSNVFAAASILPALSTDTTLSFLPLSHVFQRMVDFQHFWKGVTIVYAHSVYTVGEDIKVVGPTIVCAVPRLYEKVYSAVMGATGVKKALIDWSVAVGAEWVECKVADRRPGLSLRLRYALADRLVFSKVKAAVGGKLRYFVSGSAPLSPRINAFFYGMGITILEGYGLTETSPVTNVNTLEDFRIGTVGKAMPGTEIKIEEDGEILIRGRQVMAGYLNLPEVTAEVIDSEGWFRTGDIGEIDDDGFLRITDRKKDLLKTSGGKYIAPQQIENMLKTHRLIEQAVVIGDGRKFCSVIVVPDFLTLVPWAAELGLNTSDPAELIERREVQDMFEAELGSQLRGLARYEMPKKIGLIAQAFSIEDGTLTPTQKVKRRVVEERYREMIKLFYDEASVDKTVFTARAVAGS
jgi:long-chain acyl-CoA synthetase